MVETRRQLTLFLNEQESDAIESIRQRFNPVQYQLINSHITLCREDEITDWAAVQQNLETLPVAAFTLATSPAERFSAGKGVYIPIKDETQQFQRLREVVLHQVMAMPRAHEPHITLMHPRNSTCTDAIFAALQAMPIPSTLSITHISVIEQEIGKAWQTLADYPLQGTERLT